MEYGSLAMLVLFAATTHSVLAAPLRVRNGPPWTPADPRMVMTARELRSRIAKVDASVLAGKPNDGGPVELQGRYRAQLEWRNAPQLNTNVHETDAELFVVVAGSGTMKIGGKLLNPRRAAPNRWEGPTWIGTGAEGATSYRVSKGDVIMIPQNMAHTVSAANGKLVLWSRTNPTPGPMPRRCPILAECPGFPEATLKPGLQGGKIR